MQPNQEQSAAIEATLAFLESKDKRFFLLSGFAGTGKTFCIKHLADKVKGRFVFTAPTNKATKVIRDTMTTETFKPECRTIYSLLGLRLEANGEVKQLAAPEDPVDLSQYRAVIVDEASMVNRSLFDFIKQIAAVQGVKFIFMGDAAQLPPVGEDSSPIWKNFDATSRLEKVMRHDNQILTLATAIRKVVDHPAPRINLASDNADGTGVWRETSFSQRIMDAAAAGRFSRPGEAKAIAWRNSTVNSLNSSIRRVIFDNAASKMWLPDDRVLIAEPAKDANQKLIATTDDEGTITRVEEDWHPNYADFKIWRVGVTVDDNRQIALMILHEDSVAKYFQEVERRAEEARRNRRLWPAFWEFKEAFHSLRHAYAITAHRAQGSTYDAVFVDWRDILTNRNRQEAFRCLYVACTRPKRELYLN